jgi:hypothetical protein
MKKMIVVLVALILAGPYGVQAVTQNTLVGKVVRVSGTLSGLGVVAEYKAGSYIILDGIDGSSRQTLNFQNQDYRLEVLADSREAYVQLQRDGLVPEDPPVAVTSSRSVPASPYLDELATRAKKMRISSGIQSMILGVIVSGVGVAFLATGNDAEVTEAGGYLLAGGVVVSGLGALDLAVKSGLERKNEHAQTLSLAEREAYCADALASESKKAQIGRYISGGLALGLATFCLVAKPLPVTDEFIYQDFDWNIYGAVAFGLSGMASILIPSYEERTYRRYQDEKAEAEGGGRLAWNIGMIPRGFALAVRYYF